MCGGVGWVVRWVVWVGCGGVHGDSSMGLCVVLLVVSVGFFVVVCGDVVL